MRCVERKDLTLGKYLNEVHTTCCPAGAPGIGLPPRSMWSRSDAERHKTAYAGDWTPASLAAGLQHTPRIGLCLDTSAMTVEQMADFVLGHAAATTAGQR